MMSRSELEVKKHFKKQGYDIVDLNPTVFLYNILEDKVGLASALSEEVGKAKFYQGCPDFLVYEAVKEDEKDWTVFEAFFVEVKSENDSLRPEQIDWLINNSVEVPTNLAIVKDSVELYRIEIE